LRVCIIRTWTASRRITRALTPSCKPGTPVSPATSLNMSREVRNAKNAAESEISPALPVDGWLIDFNLTASNLRRMTAEVLAATKSFRLQKVNKLSTGPAPFIYQQIGEILISRSQRIPENCWKTVVRWRRHAEFEKSDPFGPTTLFDVSRTPG
jgi:hypothetical protein